MSTRQLKHLLRPQTLQYWAPTPEFESIATRAFDWMNALGQVKQAKLYLSPSPPAIVGGGLWFVFATGPALLAALDHLIESQAAVIVIPQIEATRAPREIRWAIRANYLGRGTRILGPDAAHWMVQQGRFSLPLPEWPRAITQPVQPGHIAVLTQSPSIGACILDWVRGRQIGLSHLFCVGGSADINVADLVDMLVQDPHCHAIVIQIDRLRIPARFISALRSCTRQKPVMVLHTGRVRDFQTEQDPDDVIVVDRELLYRAAIARAGASALDTLDECFQALESLTKRKPHEGRHLTILGPGDGLEALAADHFFAEDPTQQSVAIRKEPAWFASPETFPVDEVTLASIRQGTDGVLIPLVAERLVQPGASPFKDWAERLLVFESRLHRPVFIAAPGMVLGRELRVACDAMGLATYGTPEQALTGFLSLSRHDHATRLVDASVPPDDPDALQPGEPCYVVLDLPCRHN